MMQAGSCTSMPGRSCKEKHPCGLQAGPLCARAESMTHRETSLEASQVWADGTAQLPILDGENAGRVSQANAPEHLKIINQDIRNSDSEHLEEVAGAHRVSSLELLLGIKCHGEITANLTGRLAAACQKVTGKRLTDPEAAKEAMMRKLPRYGWPEADPCMPMLFGYPR